MISDPQPKNQLSSNEISDLLLSGFSFSLKNKSTEVKDGKLKDLTDFFKFLLLALAMIKKKHFFFNVYLLLRERERERRKDKETQNPKQAPGSELSA